MRRCSRNAAAHVAAALGLLFASAQAATPADSLWSRQHSVARLDPRGEALVEQLLGKMSLRDKVAQMTQPDIRYVTPEDVAEFRLGSILNGGGAWPNGNRAATAADWLALANAYHDASTSSGSVIRVPVLWGTDAVHGHNNVRGATLFPHNIGLGAARDPALVRDIGKSVGRAVRATGIRWVFAPTLAVVENPRWGRTYESFSSDPVLVESYARAYVSGLQGTLRGGNDVVATAKHFLGDGGTQGGVDQGDTRIPEAYLARVHGRGYVGALEAGVQTVMASYNSWTDSSTGKAHGKMHGNGYLLNEVLKGKWGFDGFVVSDWNAIGQLPGCSNASCPAAINAGIDMVMVPEEWRAFIANTVQQVESGVIPLSRIDDAVTRILRVKWRAGLLDGADTAPASGAFAGQQQGLEDRDLARHAVRQSLVLLRNSASVLPLRRDANLLVAGRAADSLPIQAGGWSVTWQGDGTSNADFPGGTTVLGGLRAALGDAHVTYKQAPTPSDLRGKDAVILVLGEVPYAETAGDVPAPAPLSHARRFPDDLRLLESLSGQGVPVVTVVLTGRPQEMNRFIALSSAFVVAWLPGTEGAGISDVLLRTPDGRVAFDFHGTLPFPWPLSPCVDTPHAEAIPLGAGGSYEHPPVERWAFPVDLALGADCAQR